jgi:hypothetical protein
MESTSLAASLGILGGRNRLSCQDATLCDGQLNHLTSELEDAKKQIRYLVGNVNLSCVIF